jgi:hypothetical protein
MRFLDVLQEDGLSMTDVEQVMQALARRFLDLEVKPPGGGVFDLVGLVESEEVFGSPLPENVKLVPEPDKIERTIQANDLRARWGPI